MQIWNAVIDSKIKKGFGVRDIGSDKFAILNERVHGIEVLDQDANIIYGTDNTSVLFRERKIGQHLIVAVEDKPNSEGKWEMVYASARGTFQLKIKEQLLLDPYENDLVIIYHDFLKIEKGAISGTQFATCVQTYQESLGGKAHLVHANGSYEAVAAELRKIGNTRKNYVYRLIIATHGSSGQLWLGNPDKMKPEWAVAAPEQGKAFIAPVEFGTLLKEVFGPGLSISILCCHFALKEGANVATAIRQAAEATALYAGTNMVYLNGNIGDRPTASCIGAVVIFKAAVIEVNAKKIPVFEAFPAK